MGFVDDGGSLPQAPTRIWGYSDFDALASWCNDIRTRSVDSLSAIAGAAAGVTVVKNRVGNIGKYQITIPRTVWTATDTAQVLTIMTLPAKVRVRGAILDVTTKLAGLAGTIQVSMGDEDDGDSLTVVADVKTAAVTLGLADADLGVGIIRAGAIQGGYIPSWTAAKGITVTLVSGTGNIGTAGVTNLTTGVMTVTLTLEDLR